MMLKQLSCLLALAGVVVGTTAAEAPTREEKIEQAAVKKAPAIRPMKTVVYRTIDGKDLTLDFFFPKDWKASDKREAILFFHGGGWSAGAPKQFYLHAQYYASRGMVTACASYRLGKTGDDIINGVTDARSAVRYLRSHAAEFGINPGRLIVSGSSAGAHLAQGTALCEQLNHADDDSKVSTEPQLLLLFCPVADLGPRGYAPGYRRMGERYGEVSPLQRLRPGMPPMLILLGDKDTVLPPKQAAAFKAAVEAKGGECALEMFPGVKHGAFYAARQFDAAKLIIEAFLLKHGFKLAPEKRN